VEGETGTVGAETPSEGVDGAAAECEKPIERMEYQDSGLTNNDNVSIISANSDGVIPNCSLPTVAKLDSEEVTVAESEDPSSQDTLDSGVGSSSSDPTDMESEHIPTNETGVGICLLKSCFQEKSTISGGVWFEDGWRRKLCQCLTCKVSS